MAQKSALFWDPKIYFSKNDLYRGNFMRGIDCAHSRTLKTLPWPWFRGKMAFEEKSVFFRISQQIRKKIIFASKTQFFLESGSGKRFHASGMRAIDSSHGKTPLGTFSNIFLAGVRLFLILNTCGNGILDHFTFSLCPIKKKLSRVKVWALWFCINFLFVLL